MKRGEVPIEERSLKIPFLAVSVLVALGMLWAVVDEVWTRRPWKRYQADYWRLELQAATQALAQWEQEAREPPARDRLRSLETRLQDAEARLSSAEHRDAQAELERHKRRFQELTHDFQLLKSESDELYYLYKKDVHEGRPSDGAKTRLDRLEARMKEFRPSIEFAMAETRRAELHVKRYREEVAARRDSLARLTAERDRLIKKIEAVRRRRPAIDQIVLEHFDRDNFGKPVARVDRCRTCHLGVENPDVRDAPEPFGTHSYIIQHHPVEKFGCTVCHGGQGVALEVEAAHGQVEFWDAPPLADGDRERLCGKCHQEAVVIPEAPTLSLGRRLFETYGCLGCHNVEGYVKVPNIGPPLEKIHTKVEPGWLLRWILDPKAYLPKTKMPNFRFSEEQARAIRAYLLSPLARPGDAGRSGGVAVRDEKLVEEGRLLFGMSRCVSCHALNGVGGTLGPDLGRISLKVRPAWLRAWLRNPRAYQPNTKMPRYRFTERQLTALVAYLGALGRDEARPQDDELPRFTDEEIRKGTKLMEEYGCLGCHDPVGQELVGGKVGADLTVFGDKTVDDLDFGDVLTVERSLPAWVQAKLQDPRSFSTERIQLKMPDFGFTPEQARALSTVLLGFTGDRPPDAYIRVRPTNESHGPPGEFGRIVSDLNCLTCHEIDGRGGDLAPALSHEGSRANAAWLREFLRNPYTLRPTLVERMPRFNLSDAEIEVIVRYMKTVLVRDDIPADLPAGQLSGEADILEGKRLYEEKYQCQTCHQIDYQGGTMGPELISSDTSIGQRRTPGWIYAWIRNPRALDPRTREPVLGLSDDEALCITRYLLAKSDGGGTP